jgi:SAM-dependent methyltransferase
MVTELNDFYLNGEYLRNNPGWGAEDAEFKTKELVKAINRYGGQWSTLIDVGCGAGHVAHNLAEVFPEKKITGSELSPDALAIAQTLRSDNLDFVGTSPFGGSLTADIVTSLDVFEHVDDAEEFLRQIRRVAPLKIFHVPLEVTVLTALRPATLASARASVRHVHFYNRNLALSMIRDSGMDVISAEYTKAALIVPKRTWTKVANLFRFCFFGIAPHLTVRLFGGFSLMVVAR